MEARGFERSFVESIDLNNYMFKEGMLIFSVRDERGRVVGFSARDMSHSKDSKKSKFINTSAKCPIYNKGIILYGLNIGKKNGSPLYIFEGYPDYVTAYKYGIKNTCAIGGTALTREHIALLRSLGIFDIILALDGDLAGQIRTEKLLDEYFGGDETIRIRILKLPSNIEECDPDDFIGKYGVEEFKKLQLLTPFQWRLERFNYDAKPEEICDRMVPFIISDPNEVHREAMSRELANKTGIGYKTILKQVDKLINSEEAEREGAIQSRVKQLMDDLRFSKNDPITMLEATAEDIRRLSAEVKEDVNSFSEVLVSAGSIRDVFEKRVPGLQGWKTGFTMLDESISGIPKEDSMITFAGDSNTGKTGFVFNLALNLAKFNPELMVLFMSIDDSRQQALSRLVALEAKIKICQVSHPSQNTTEKDDRQKLDNGWSSLCKLIAEERFSIKDQTHGNTLDFAEGWIRWAKEKHPERKIVFFLDNFHKLGDEREKDERIRFKHASARIHSMKTKLHFTAICTMEIRKLIGSFGGQRPSLQEISESKQMEFDNNLIGMVYNEVHYRREDAKVFWSGISNGRQVKKPIFEVDIQKNKISEFKDVLYYKFNPEYSAFSECDSLTVSEWKHDYEEALRRVADKRFPTKGENPFYDAGGDN
jgi:replicative DNA helicase